jgi:hypothetical protein
MKKIAFLFLTLDNPHFPKLWDSYFKGNENKYTLYIHPKYQEKVTWRKENIINKLHETSRGFIVRAYIELMREAYKNKDNFKFVIISESEIPIKSFDQFYKDVINDGRSWIKNMKIDKYSREEIIGKMGSKKKFIKHYSRMCLNREDVGLLLEKDKKGELDIFYNMYVGDEYFLSAIYPKKYKDFEVTYDDWEYTHDLKKKIKNMIRQKYEIQESGDGNMSVNIQKLREEFDEISSHPKTIHVVSKDDLLKIKSCKSYFYRKFAKDSDIQKYIEKIIMK